MAKKRKYQKIVRQEPLMVFGDHKVMLEQGSRYLLLAISPADLIA